MSHQLRPHQKIAPPHLRIFFIGALIISAQLCLPFRFNVLKANAQCPPISPGISVYMIDYAERCYWKIVRKWKTKPSDLTGVVCAFSVGNDGALKNLRILKPAEESSSALSLIRTSLRFEEPKVNISESQEFIIEFGRYPNLSIKLQEGETRFPAWPPDWYTPSNNSKPPDSQVIGESFDHCIYPLEAHWTEEKDDVRSVSCLFRISANGDVSNVRIAQSSGSNEIDQAAVNAIKADVPPFEHLKTELEQSHELLIEFFSTDQIRVKLKEVDSDKFSMIGRSAAYPVGFPASIRQRH